MSERRKVRHMLAAMIPQATEGAEEEGPGN